MAAPAEARAPRAAPAYRTLAKGLEDDILRGRLAIGAAMPSETALAAQYGVNRSTIREAIRLLEQDGLVARRDGGKKLFVTAPGERDIARRLRSTMILREVTFHDLYEVMAALEPMAAAAGARGANEAALAALADNLHRTEQALGSGAELVALDLEFHALVAEASGNRALQVGWHALGELFHPAFLQVMLRLNAGERLLYAHRQIHAALRNGDEKQARAWMERHIADFKRGCELANLDFDGPIGGDLARVQQLD